MEVVTLPLALTIVGSLAAICLTAIKIIMIRSDNDLSRLDIKHIKDIDEKLDELVTKVTILEVKSNEADKLHAKVDRLNDLLLKFFSDVK